MRKVGFTGTSSHVPTLPQTSTLSAVLAQLRAKGAVELHHGEAEVADELAGNMARARGWRIVGHPSSMHEHRCEVDERVEARPPLIRDHDIVDETECLVAMPWRSEYLRNGEWATIRYARKVGKPITIIWPDGTIS